LSPELLVTRTSSHPTACAFLPAAGNLIVDPPGNPVRHSYTYDAENRLIGITDQGVTYTYDAEGRRIGTYTAGALTRTYLRDQDQSSFATSS
jgi:YD repeat-containing protein